LSKSKKFKNNFPKNKIGKNPNEKMINTSIESKKDPIIDLDCFFDLALGFVILRCNLLTIINLFEN